MIYIGFTLFATVLFVNISPEVRGNSFHLSVCRNAHTTAYIFNGRTGKTDLQCNKNFSFGISYSLLRSPEQIGPNKEFCVESL